MGISSPGIGSNLDVNGIVAKLMQVESQPLTTLAKKEASFQAKLSAFGLLSGAVGSFQSSLTSLSTLANFQSVTANSSDSSVATGTATSKAVAGTYNVNVTQLAQKQTIATAGQASTTAAIGAGGSTTLSFQFGTISGGTFGVAGSTLGAGVASGGIADGSLTINGTAISTDANTTSAKLLAAAINAKTSTTGVSATAQATATAALGAFTDTNTTGTYTLDLVADGTTIHIKNAVDLTAGAVTAADIDTSINTSGAGSVGAALAAAGITFTGSAATNDLVFTSASGKNIDLTETLAGGATGGYTTTLAGATVQARSSVSLSSANASRITVGGNSPTTAGLTAGEGGAYIGASFTQDATQASGNVVIDGTNNSLQGIRDAINKANLGVTATIVSDGSATPYHLVLTSNKTGATSSLKIDVTGAPADPALTTLLAYDPAGTQNLKQSSAAQNTALTVNGIAVSSTTSTVSDAIQGVTLTVAKTGTTNLTVAQDTASVKTSVNAFVKAYNDFNSTLKNLTAYDASTKQGGPLLGDSTTQRIQAQIRKQLSTSIPGLSGSLTTLSQIGITFQKDGSLALDSSKLQTAITNNFSDISGLFTVIGKTSDSLVSFVSSTSATKAGSYAVDLTQLATQGSLSGNTNLTLAPTTIASDTTLSATVDGTSATVALTAGTYTAAQLAALVQAAINGASAFSNAGSSVTTSIDGSGFLNIISNRYGSTSKIGLASLSGTSVAALLGAAPPPATDGVDVAGTIGGSAAGGSGQFLTGAAGSLAEGLKVQITGGATGSRGTINFSQGYAYQLNKLADTFLGGTGLISGRTTGLNNSIKDIGKTRDAVSARLIDVEKRLRAQFTALDKTISGLSSTSTFLTQQLANLPKIS